MCYIDIIYREGDSNLGIKNGLIALTNWSNSHQRFCVFYDCIHIKLHSLRLPFHYPFKINSYTKPVTFLNPKQCNFRCEYSTSTQNISGQSYLYLTMVVNPKQKKVIIYHVVSRSFITFLDMPGSTHVISLGSTLLSHDKTRSTVVDEKCSKFEFLIPWK